MNKKKWIGIGSVLFAVLILLGCWLLLPVISFRFTHVYFIALAVGMLVAAIGFLDYSKPSFKKIGKAGAVISLLAVVAILGSYVVSFSAFNWETKKNMLQVEESVFDKSVSNVDMSNLVILDETDAIKFSEKLITEKDPALGSIFNISEDYGTLSVVEGKPYWIFPLEHSGFFKWMGHKTAPGYIQVNATDGSSKFVEKPFEYAPSSYFGKDLKRYVYTKFPSIGLTDYSFEVDDKGNPKWVITAYTHKTGVTGTQVLGSVIVDASTGETLFHELGKQPLWVDRVYSLDIFEEQLEDWGKYANGWWNPSDTGKLKNTEGFGYVFNDGNIYFYTGVTSYGGDEATTGFMIFNPRNGQAKYNRISGSTENKSVGLMEELVQNAGYTAKYPYLLNINGEATFFSTLKGNSNNIVGYAFASVQNYRAVAWGQTLKEAQTNYARALIREGSSTNAIGAQTDQTLTVKGEISRVGITSEGYYLVKILGREELFMVSSEQFPLVALSHEKDVITIQYLKTEEKKLIDAMGFTNTSIQ